MEKLTLIHATTSKSSFLLLRSHSLNTFLDSATYNRYSVCNGGESINNVGRRQNDEDDVTQNEKQSSQYLHS